MDKLVSIIIPTFNRAHLIIDTFKVFVHKRIKILNV